MLAKVQSRQEYLGLSLRSLAAQIEVSPTLLSLVLSGKRESSEALSRKFSTWLRTPVSSQGSNCPSALVDQFINERASYLAASTLDFYRHKLHPFVMWC
jgi:transcriptional regulator with XRE-family HTH domain